MREMIQPIINFSLHDPAAVFGLLLIGGAGILYFHIQLKMIKAGYPMSANEGGNSNAISKSSRGTWLVAVAGIFTRTVRIAWDCAACFWFVPTVIAT